MFDTYLLAMAKDEYVMGYFVQTVSGGFLSTEVTLPSVRHTVLPETSYMREGRTRE